MQYLGGKSRIAKDISQVIVSIGGGCMRYQGGKSRIAGQLSQTIAELAPQRERERERTGQPFLRGLLRGSGLLPLLRQDNLQRQS